MTNGKKKQKTKTTVIKTVDQWNTFESQNINQVERVDKGGKKTTNGEYHERSRTTAKRPARFYDEAQATSLGSSWDFPKPVDWNKI